MALPSIQRVIPVGSNLFERMMGSKFELQTLSYASEQENWMTGLVR